jgi:uncharacterized protein
MTTTVVLLIIYKEGMTAEQSREVIDILDMHRALRFAYSHLEDKSAIDDKDLRFSGFDGNLEGEYLSYTRYICLEHGHEKWRELHDGKIANSHARMLGIYRRMLKQWYSCEDKYRLTKKDVCSIISARDFPE